MKVLGQVPTGHQIPRKNKSTSRNFNKSEQKVTIKFHFQEVSKMQLSSLSNFYPKEWCLLESYNNTQYILKRSHWPDVFNTHTSMDAYKSLRKSLLQIKNSQHTCPFHACPFLCRGERIQNLPPLLSVNKGEKMLHISSLQIS